MLSWLIAWTKYLCITFLLSTCGTVHANSESNIREELGISRQWSLQEQAQLSEMSLSISVTQIKHVMASLVERQEYFSVGTVWFNVYHIVATKEDTTLLVVGDTLKPHNFSHNCQLLTECCDSKYFKFFSLFLLLGMADLGLNVLAASSNLAYLQEVFGSLRFYAAFHPPPTAKLSLE